MRFTALDVVCQLLIIFLVFIFLNSRLHAKYAKLTFLQMSVTITKFSRLIIELVKMRLCPQHS